MTDPENERTRDIEADPELFEPEVPETEDEGPEERDAAQGPSSPRMRGLLAGLITVAIVAVLAIAIFDEGDDGDDPPDTPTTAADQAVTTEGDGNQQVVDGPELGSLSITGYSCPEASSPDEACMEPGPVEILNATLRLEDGTTMQLAADMRQEDGSYAWLNIPVGEYVLLADGLLGPDGASARDVAGASGQSEDGWTIPNTDPNQPTVLQVFFIPVEEGTAAG